MPGWEPKEDQLNQQIIEEETRLKMKRDWELDKLLFSRYSQPIWQPPENIAPPVDTYAPDIEQLPQIEIPQPQFTPDLTSQFEIPSEPEPDFVPVSQPVSRPRISETPVPEKGTIVPKEVTPEWWEQPKALTEKGMELLGKGISKVPVLPKALQFIAPVFEWVHNNLEKPFAAMITSPFSPALPFQQGESWLDHEKREYDTWKAPTYVKGLAEFAMPLWWLPILGWGAKGAKALGAGEKLAQAIARPTSLALPTKEVLNKTLFQGDYFRHFSNWSQNVPVLKTITKAIGGEAAFARDLGEVYPAMDIATRKMIAVNAKNSPVALTDMVRREIVKRSVIYEMRHGYKGLQTPSMLKHGNPYDVLQIDKQGMVLSANPIGAEGAKLGVGLSEVFEHPDLYNFVNPQAKAMVQAGNKILAEIRAMAEKEGVDVTTDVKFHRMVTGKMTPDGFEASEYGSNFELKRHYKTMSEAIEANFMKGTPLIYDTDVIKSIESTIDYYFKKIANKRFDDEVGKLGMTIPDIVATFQPDLMEKITATGTRVGSASYALQAIREMQSRGGRYLPGGVMGKIQRGMPAVSERLHQLFALQPADVDRVINSLGREVFREAKMTPTEFKIALSQLTEKPGRYLMRDIDNAINQLNINKATANNALLRAYHTVYQSRRNFIKESLDKLKTEMDGVVKTSKDELSGLKQTYRNIANEYIESRGQILGTGLAKFQRHPAFRNRIFDKQAVDLVEKVEGARGNEWMRDMANISGFGRTLIAALDFSAPFIQGLVTLGRNPVAWSRGVKKQFEFFANPTNFYKYLDDPVTKAISAERWTYGGSRSSFEFFQALKPIQEKVGRIPVVGKIGQKAITQTYGRAEAAFTGFGEVARNEMWKALKRPNMGDQELRELARTVDRMTGVMSTEALAMSQAQSQFENAFVFFAPRYTRAGLAYAADIFKGGMAGAEARKGLGSMIASGTVMYYGIAKALGQEPNFDPSSAKFLTIKVGDSHIGIGGIFYSLTRLATDVAATSLSMGEKTPLDFISLSRYDNPFIKFMFNRTSPLTGTIANVIEQKDYFGEPFESPADWGKFLLQKVTPIAMQRTVLEPERAHPAVFLSEVMGGREFPKSAFELQDERREALALQEVGLPYDNLDMLQRKKIDMSPEVTQFQEEIDKTTTQRGRALSVGFLQRRRELEMARDTHKQQISALSQALQDGLIDGVTFKDYVTKANYGYGATYEHINENPTYADVMKKLQEPKDVGRQYQWELAYDELMGANFDNQTGIFDFKAYENFVTQLRQKYGDGNMDRALEFKALKYQDYPEPFQELQRAKEVLKPYWGVAEKIEKMFGKRYAESSRGEALIQKERKRMRLTNPEVGFYYDMFYKKALLTNLNQ